MALTLGQALTSPDFTDEEKAVIKWQLKQCGGFKDALWKAITAADDDNLELLGLGFPLEVSAYRGWAFGDLATKIRDKGFEI